MPSYSSVVRKPGQKILPKGPKRNVQRNPARHVAPPSLTPESQTVSPAVEPIDKVPENQEPVLESQLETEEPESVPDTNAIPSIVPPIVPSILPSIETAREARSQIASYDESAIDRVPSVTVEISAPSSTSHGVQILHPVSADETQKDTTPTSVPTIAVSTASLAARKRKAAKELTPTPSEESTQEKDAPGQSRKRRKSAHATQFVDAEVRTTPPADTISSILRSSPRHRRSESRTSDALLQDATAQAAAVSDLANDIENRARSARSRSVRRSTSLAVETEESNAEAGTTTRPKSAKKKKKKKKKKSRSEKIQDLAQQVVENAMNGGNDQDDSERRRRSRLTTPENAEELEIDPQEVSMSELTKDIKIGRKSETEKRMQENWTEIKERRKQEVEKRREAARKKRGPPQQEEREPEEAAVPKQIIINGQIVVANESREVALNEGLEHAARENADVAIEDDRIYKYVNQGTLGKNAGRDNRTKWDEETTGLFFQGLRMFGTDFSMIANLFPESIDRRVVKKKYLAELLVDAEKVETCVAAKETVSLDEYTAATNMEFEDPEKLYAELDEMTKQLREEDAKRRADQGFVMNNEEADIPIPSTEGGEGPVEGPEAATEGEPQEDGATTPAPSRRPQAGSTARSERIRNLADQVVQDAVAPKKKQQRKARESTGAGRGGRSGRKGKRAAEGLEERVGPLEDFE